MDVEQTPTQIVVRTVRYRLEFHRAGDRWRHVLFVDDTLALESIESPPEEKAPMSPAFQDLLVERGADTCEIQLFGQCGKQVYSAAVRCDDSQVHFDVSVRDGNETPVPARSRYRVPLPHGLTISAQLGECAISEDACEIRADEELPPTSAKGRTRRWAYRIHLVDASE